MEFSKSQLKLLSSKKGIQRLLSRDKPDYKDAVRKLEYERQVFKLQAELNKAHSWIIENNKRVLILVEGREFAGKGEAIRIFTDHLNPRNMRLVALQKPTERERSQWYFKRYIEHIPETAEMCFFDRSWYNRALVEPVHGFCTDKEYKHFMKEVNHFERMLSEDGIHIIKFYFSVTKKEQYHRIEEIKANPLKKWQLTKVDLEAQELWEKYTSYKKLMFEKTNTEEVPWHRIDANDLKSAILKALRTILEEIPYTKEKA
ncbi:MAG: polyphosphate kinase 2 [Bacteroidetes bacterium]|nr:polyphosphate kinase 2 [Bacteroidota bacterium]